MKIFTLNRNFNLLIIGQIITLFGSSILRFALSLFILDITGSAGTFAFILAVSTIPTIFLSPIGGAIADRVNRRNLLVILDLISGLIVAGLAFFLFSGVHSILLIGIVMTLLSIVSTFYQPTVQASIPVLIENDHLLKANGVVSGVSALTNFAGPVLGGLLYSFQGIEWIVVMTSVSFFLCAIVETFMYIPFEKMQQTYGAIRTILNDLKDGISYIVKKNSFLLKIIIIAAVMNIFITPIFLVGIPYIIKIIMGLDGSFFGYTQGGISLSMIFAAVAIGLLSSRIKVSNLYKWFVGSGILFIPMALSVYPLFLSAPYSTIISYIMFSLCAMLIMFSITIINIFVMTILQQQTPNLLLGKVMAILTAVSTCAVPIGQILFGTLMDSFTTNVYALLLIVAVVTIAIAITTKVLLKERKAAHADKVDEAIV